MRVQPALVAVLHIGVPTCGRCAHSHACTVRALLAACQVRIRLILQIAADLLVRGCLKPARILKGQLAVASLLLPRRLVHFRLRSNTPTADASLDFQVEKAVVFAVAAAAARGRIVSRLDYLAEAHCCSRVGIRELGRILAGRLENVQGCRQGIRCAQAAWDCAICRGTQGQGSMGSGQPPEPWPGRQAQASLRGSFPALTKKASKAPTCSGRRRRGLGLRRRGGLRRRPACRGWRRF